LNDFLFYFNIIITVGMLIFRYLNLISNFFFVCFLIVSC